MKVDLHIHTTASDGSWTPGQVVENSRLAGVGFLAVTDHDSTANVMEAEVLAKEAGLVFCRGVEISSTLAGQSFHILGYHVDPQSVELQQLLKHNVDLMEEADHESIKKLIAAGLKLDYQEYIDYQHNPARGGWKSLSFLIDKGLCTGAPDFFTNFFTPLRGITFPEFPSPARAIEAIHLAGGIPVLAHPGSAFHGNDLEETLNYFGKMDIAGVECYHPSHSTGTVRAAADWSRRHSKLITGGSDCHGIFLPERRLGYPDVDVDDLVLGPILHW
ncbi:PHP domain-containing protein [Anaerospora hongkongensis]|uniref:PHP domain-containing protein n=2 Tax=Anaerospora hongkongensis TaxID=244830 RepID=UPI00289C8663|nr:PHP domain-containing protein [Anaerospora hongkongensis]